ncbi:MAG: hypothetical protein KJ621_11755, partial [Proteobacteria bacterium]|nr:hypothetical protein [Pseudomonadota bacterium]
MVREIEGAIRDVLMAVDIEQKSESDDKTESNHKQRIRDILNRLAIPADNDVAVSWLAMAKSFHGIAHRTNLDPPRPLDNEFKDFWHRFIDILDIVLDKSQANFNMWLNDIDNILARGQLTKKDIGLIYKRVPNSFVAYNHLFSNLNDPKILSMKKARTFFKSIPVKREDGGFPPWPQSGYIARMAKSSVASVQQDVLKLILGLPETDNPWVQMDLLDAGLALPSDLAARMKQLVTRWIESDYTHMTARRLGKFMAHLAAGGELDAAFYVAKCLLKATPLAEKQADSRLKRIFARQRQPVGNLDFHNYEIILKENCPILFQADLHRGFSLICDLLQDRLDFTVHGDNADGSGDNSHFWRPTIADEGRKYSRPVENLLVSVCRDLASNLVQYDPATAPDIISSLEQRRWDIFVRMALYVLSLCASHYPDLVQNRLLNKVLFDAAEWKREYLDLAEAGFGLLDSQNQETIIDWIENGPNMNEYKTHYQEAYGEEISDKLEKEYCDSWRLARAFRIRKYLSSDWQLECRELVKRYGRPSAPRDTTGVIRWGDISPLSKAELLSLNTWELLDYLVKWQPDHPFTAPSKSGLAKQLEEAAAEASWKFSSIAHLFKIVPPNYVSGLLSGLGQGAKQGKLVDYGPVLDLILWIAKNGHDGPNIASESGDEWSTVKWSWTRKETIRFLGEQLDRTTYGIPYTFRKKAWDAIEVFIWDNEPERGNEKEYGDSYLIASMNGNRSLALMATTQYMFWVRRHNQKRNGDSDFAGMPEVQRALEEHLDINLDPSPAVRSVYGQRIPWIRLEAPKWAEDNLPLIFPADKKQSEYWLAAWEGYILQCDPFNDVLPLLMQQYALAVKL